MLRHLDLFSGIGGFALAARMVGGYETVAFCEIEPYAQAVLRKHWPGVPVYDDVRTLPDVECDVVTAGFPCQDISNAGRRAGIDGERSGLWHELPPLIGRIRPRYVLLENVSALLGRGLSRVLGDLATVGYDAEWHCVPAAYVGAPHIRDRVWIVAFPQHTDADRERSHRAAGDARPAELRHEQGGDARPLRATLADADEPGLAQRIMHPGISIETRCRDAGKEPAVGGEKPGRNPGRRARSTEVERERPGLCADESAWLRGRRSSDGGGEGNLLDPDGLHESSIESDRGGPRLEPERGSAAAWWSTEPDVGRVAHGIPARVDRLRGLGNAIVPQVAAIFLEAIKDSLT